MSYSYLKNRLEYWKLRAVLISKVLRLRKMFFKKYKRVSLSGDFLRSYQQRWGRLSGMILPYWPEMYTAVSGKENLDYICEDIYYAIIEPTLNDKRLVLAYTDKNMYDTLLGKEMFPQVFFRNMHGSLLDGEYRLARQPVESYLDGERVFVKPSIDSGSGKNVDLFVRDAAGCYRNASGEKLTQAYLDEHYSKNYLIQRAIEQHGFYSNLSDTSVNTIRVQTYRSVKTDEVRVLCAALRVGGQGAIVDNQNAGGIACELDKQGRVIGCGTDKFSNLRYELGAGRKLKDIGQLPYYEEILNAAKATAEKLPYCRILGFDMCLNSQNKPVIIEINMQWLCVNLFQMCGNGLLGESTDEIIDHCAVKMKQGFIVY